MGILTFRLNSEQMALCYPDYSGQLLLSAGFDVGFASFLAPLLSYLFSQLLI